MRRLAMACVMVLTALVGAPPAPAAGTADVATADVATADVATAGEQLRWVVEVSHRLPVPADEQNAHLAPSFLAAVGGTDGFDEALRPFGELTLTSVPVDSPAYVVGIVESAQGTLYLIVQTDGTGLVAGLLLRPYLPEPRSFAEIDEVLGELAPQASFLSAVIEPDGRCRTVHGLAADTRRPLGSAFKLYVLGALGYAVANGRAAWDEPLAVRDDWKSLPSGRLQDSPAGTVLPLRRYADLMIAISDNTATDHLVHRLGRAAVQAQFARFGNSRPAASAPVLTTRDLFVLKGVRYPAGADAYLRLPRLLRAAALPALGRVPLAQVQAWPEPRKINQIEWFGSPADMCRAFAGLAEQNADPALAPIGHALALNDGALGLDRSRYPTVWFKGGSEPGVLTLNYLARTAAGRTIVSSVMLADQDNPLDAGLEVYAQQIIRAGIHLVDTNVSGSRQARVQGR